MSKKVNQKEVAESIHVSSSSYSDYETNKTEPSFNILIDLANYYNVSIDYLLGNTDIKTPYFTDKKLCEYLNECIKTYNKLFK